MGENPLLQFHLHLQQSKSHRSVNINVAKQYSGTHALWVASVLYHWEQWEEQDFIRDGFFPFLFQPIEDDINLTKRQQHIVIKELHKDGMVEQRKDKLPGDKVARNFYRFTRNFSDLYFGKGEYAENPDRKFQVKNENALYDTCAQARDLKSNFSFLRSSESSEDTLVSSSYSSSLQKKKCSAEASTGENNGKNKPCRADFKNVGSKRPKPILVPQYAKEMIEYWEESGFKKAPASTTKSFRNLLTQLKLLKNGSLFNNVLTGEDKITVDDFKTVVDRAAFVAFNKRANTEPGFADFLKKAPLHNFIWNTRAKKIKSLFQHFMYYDPKPIVKTENTSALEKIKAKYKKAKGLKTSNFTLTQESNFSEAVNKLDKFVTDHRKFFRGKMTVVDLIDHLFDAIDERFKHDMVQLEVGLLRSNWTINELLPSYLTKKRVWTESDGSGSFTIYGG